jgi:hypothetical protein
VSGITKTVGASGTYRIKFGTTALLTFAASANADNSPFIIQADILVQAIGASGIVQAMGVGFFKRTTNGFEIDAQNVGSLNTTGNLVLTPYYQPDTAQSGTGAIVKTMTVEIVKV